MIRKIAVMFILAAALCFSRCGNAVSNVGDVYQGQFVVYDIQRAPSGLIYFFVDINDGKTYTAKSNVSNALALKKNVKDDQQIIYDEGIVFNSEGKVVYDSIVVK